MGFRCPNCNTDFGIGENAKKNLAEHFMKNPLCAAEAYVYTDLWRMAIGLPKKEGKESKQQKPTKQRSYSKISEKHFFVKQNLATNQDGSDTVVCNRCGLKAKRFGSSFKFDMRSIRKIENCID